MVEKYLHSINSHPPKTTIEGELAFSAGSELSAPILNPVVLVLNDPNDIKKPLTEQIYRKAEKHQEKVITFGRNCGQFTLDENFWSSVTDCTVSWD